MSGSLWPYGLEHASPFCPLLFPRVCSDSCPLSQWCSLTISSSATPFSFGLQIFPSISVFSSESALRIRWPKYCNSVKLWAVPHKPTWEGQFQVKASDKTWPTGEGNGNPLQYSCLENPMDRGAWQTLVHRVTKSQTWLSNWNKTLLN